MGWKIILSPSAECDLREIVSWIARHNQEAAVRIGEALIGKAEALAKFPDMGRVVPEFSREDLREIVFRSYRIIYRTDRSRSAAPGFPHVPSITG